MYRKYIIVIGIYILCLTPLFAQKPCILTTETLKNHVQYFNSIDDEAVKNFVPNREAFAWLSDNIPLFDSPDTLLNKVYYYRWWSFRKHLKQTPDGFVFTEFITDVKHAAKYNAVSSGLGHHIYEGRWLHNSLYINDYINFWLYADPKYTNRFHGFSQWIDDAVYNRFLVNRDTTFLQKNILALHKDYKKWETERQTTNGMFWQFDVRDAMEESISGSRKLKNVRPTINSYMYGNAAALSKMAKILKVDSLTNRYDSLAKNLKISTTNELWDSSASFYKVKYETGGLCDAREAIGFIPWYFNLPPDTPAFAKQWNQLTDSTGFRAKWGITTAERRHKLFRTHGSGHGCEWDGAVWPFATTQTLKGLSNLLNNYKNRGQMSAQVFYDELYKYAWSHQMNGRIYIGEYQDEKTGEWLKGDNPRSKFYNHSSFADLIINDLVGLKPQKDNLLAIKPLIPKNKWNWFCLDNVLYHGKILTILWDKTGRHYQRGKGFRVFVDGRLIYKGNRLKDIEAVVF